MFSMSSKSVNDDKLPSLNEWLNGQGITIHGVEAVSIPGAGIGIRSARSLKKGERIIFVPPSALITIASKIVKDIKLPATITVHGRIAAALALSQLQDGEAQSPWMKTWPSMKDFKSSMPLLWPEEDVDYLSDTAKGNDLGHTSRVVCMLTNSFSHAGKAKDQVQQRLDHGHCLT
jgi:hypothetical protein